MRLKKLIKQFRFEEDERGRITLGTSVRLHPQLNHLQLEADADGAFPTADDLYAKSWVANPLSAMQWVGFDADVTNYKVDGIVVTSVGFRLSDGTNDYWWDGGAWDNAPAAGEWNTEVEIAANISTFPVADRKIQVIVNLKTTDADYTPEVRDAKVLYSSNVEFQDDLIYRSLVPALEGYVRPKGRFQITLDADTSTIDMLNDYVLETPYTIADIDAVFDHTTDPDHFTDLLDSYDPGTKVITLTGPLTAGTVVWVDFLWQPEVTVTTGLDYSEIEKVPSLVLDDIRLVDTSSSGGQESVVNKSDGTAVMLPPCIRGDLEVLMHLITDKGFDQLLLADEIKRFFENNPTLTAVGVDEEYDLWLLDEWDMATTPNMSGLHTGRVVFRVRQVRFYSKDAVESVYSVERFHLEGDMDVTVQS